MKMESYREQAKVWDARAKVAKAGNLLYSPAESGDPGFVSTFQSLIRACTKAGRIIITSSFDKSMIPSPIPPAAVQSDPVQGTAKVYGDSGFDRFGMPKPS